MWYKQQGNGTEYSHLCIPVNRHKIVPSGTEIVIQNINCTVPFQFKNTPSSTKKVPPLKHKFRTPPLKKYSLLSKICTPPLQDTFSSTTIVPPRQKYHVS